MFNIKNILLPTDFSNLSLSAARYAVDIAKQYGARIHLLNVLEKTPPILAIRSLDLSEDKIIKTIDQDAQNSLKKALEKINQDKSVEIIPVIKKGVDFEIIVDYCESNNIDLIVIATHGRTGILHTLLGSVAEKVIRYARCPVLVITPSETEK